MSRPSLPFVVEPDELQAALGRNDILVVDLSPAQSYHQSHIPGAAHLDYAELIDPKPPIAGILPEPKRLSALFSSLGLTPDTHVVAYDDEGGSKACRLLWTLDVVGHVHYSLLNGGFPVWRSEGRPVSDQATEMPYRPYTVHINDKVITDKNYILTHLHDPAIVLVDCRSPAEYSGEDNRARRGGHIPGAVNIEWRSAVDEERNQRLKSRDDLRTLYKSMGVTPDKEVITYCHTHRRSAFTYFVLKSLGYTRIRGYPGSWSEWGNDLNTPLER